MVRSRERDQGTQVYHEAAEAECNLNKLWFDSEIISNPPFHHSLGGLQACVCLEPPPPTSLSCKGSKLKPENAPSKPTRSTSPKVRPTPHKHRSQAPDPAIVAAAVFRDQLYKHLETVPENDFDGFTNKLVQAGATLEFLKYADALFEILLVGGLLQPGGSYLDDGAPPSPFSILNAKEPTEVADLKPYVEVLNKLIRRYANQDPRA